MVSFLLVFLSIGLVWLRSSFGKFSSGNFVSTLGGTLAKTAEKNPHPWFKQFLTEVAIPGSQLFGTLVLWGEIIVGVTIVLGAILLLFNFGQGKRLAYLLLVFGLSIGVLLNMTFWLSFGYSNVATDNLNLLMAALEVIGIIFVKKQLAEN